MTKSERILKSYQKTVNPEATEIHVDSITWFYEIVNSNRKVLASGDLTKYSRGNSETKTIK